MEHEIVIEVRNLVKTYLPEDSDPIEAVRGVSFDIKSRDFAIIYGPSGCGKSTILHMLIGLEPVTSGEILLRGDNITKMDDEERSFMRAEKFGMVYQQSYWVKSLNVWENVALPLLIAG
ncbi:MAG: ATP-binding cassette domain-containing protein, partial [Candidatus Berkelbacteria bacterium]|nr:ATP-binding cassette domain-containing protein [Candidatus Berkelbacteria bacterium]